MSEYTEGNCPECGHEHAGEQWAGVCIGCPCPIVIMLDGNAWCATGEGFINLQESPAGFGDSPAEAVRNLILELAS